MIRKIVPAVALAAAIFLPAVPAISQQQNPQAQLAGLSQDVAALRSEVARLRTELDELRAENARLLALAERKIVNPPDEVTPKIAALRAELKDFIAAQRRDSAAETDAKIKRLADMTNRAIEDLSKNINRVAANAAAQNSAPVPVTKPDDFPSGGIEYTVKSGDTLGKIISKNGSKKSWILYANPDLDPDKIFPGQKLFVPQKD